MVKDMDLTVSKWDPSEHLETEEDGIAYLDAVAELDDSALRQAVIGDMTKAKGMGQITKEAGVGRESLYKSLDRNVNPSFHTIMKGSCTLSAAG